MAYIGHRCTKPKCGHRLAAHPPKKDGAPGGCEQRRHGPNPCTCREGKPGPSELLQTLNRVTGKPIETITPPDTSISFLGKTCGCDDCRALYAELTA